jgi:hypothetical protein
MTKASNFKHGEMYTIINKKQLNQILHEIKLQLGNRESTLYFISNKKLEVLLDTGVPYWYINGIT